MYGPIVDAYFDMFDADFELGTLKWKARPSRHFKSAGSAKAWNTQHAGKLAGNYANCSGYAKVYYSLNGKRRGECVHRILWSMSNCRLPVAVVDHINRDTSDNRLCNLREATYFQNNANRCGNGMRAKGTSFCRRTKKYVGQVMVGGKNIFLGRHDTEQQASDAYKSAAKKHFGEFAHG